MGHGTGGFVWCVRCFEADSQVPVERCYLVIEACTRPGCTVQYEWPVCPSCLAALTDEIAYLCLNCLYVLKLNRQLVESGKADSTEIGKRIDAFLKPGQDRFTDAEGMGTGLPQPAPHGSIRPLGSPRGGIPFRHDATAHIWQCTVLETKAIAFQFGLRRPVGFHSTQEPHVMADTAAVSLVSCSPRWDDSRRPQARRHALGGTG